MTGRVRAGPWAEIFEPDFVKEYEVKKMGSLLDQHWFNGRLITNCYMEPHNKFLKTNLLELRQAGFSPRPRKGKALSEMEEALLGNS